MSEKKAWLTTGPSQERLVTVKPDQSFYATQWNGSQEEVAALLEFADKVDKFLRWCREAKQVAHQNGVTRPLPDFIQPEKPKPTRSKRATTKRSEEQDEEGSEG